MGLRFLKTGTLVAALLAPAPADASVVNPGFESPDLGTSARYRIFSDSAVTGWSSTTGGVEIWANNFLGVTSYEGTQHAELNANRFGAIWQDLTNVNSGDAVFWSFAHRGRDGVDTLRLDIIDLGAGNTEGDGNDVLLYSGEFSAGRSSWVVNSGVSRPTGTDTTVRFKFEAVSTHNGNISVGNFIDALDVNVATPIPVPASLPLLLGAIALLRLRHRRAQ